MLRSDESSSVLPERRVTVWRTLCFAMLVETSTALGRISYNDSPLEETARLLAVSPPGESPASSDARGGTLLPQSGAGAAARLGFLVLAIATCGVAAFTGWKGNHNRPSLGVPQTVADGTKLNDDASHGANLALTPHGTDTVTPFHLIHIPKTGGTTVEMLAAATGKLLGMCAEDPDSFLKVDGAKHCNAWHVPDDPSQGRIPKSFCIIRNPFARLASAYGYWFGHSKTCGEFALFAEQIADKLLQNRHLQCRQAENSECNGGSLGPLPYEQDCHYLPQTLYTKTCETILTYERWEEDVVPWMEKVLEIPATLAHRTVKPHSPALSGVDSNDVNTNYAQCFSQMDRAIVDRIRAAYRYDFSAFGYNADPGKQTEAPGVGYTKDAITKYRAKWGQPKGGQPHAPGPNYVSKCLDAHVSPGYRPDVSGLKV